MIASGTSIRRPLLTYSEASSSFVIFCLLHADLLASTSIRFLGQLLTRGDDVVVATKGLKSMGATRRM
jgi:hypothetical protein